MSNSNISNDEPHGWMVEGSYLVYRGEYAELDAQSHASRCAGTCTAYPVYLRPQTEAVPDKHWLIRKDPNVRDKFYVAEGNPPDSVLRVYGIEKS